MSHQESGLLLPDSSLENAYWDKNDTTWALSLYGTAIGAGTLFLPINAGMNGLIPLLLMMLLAFPLTYYSHRALCRFVLSGNVGDGDITHVVDEYFGKRAGQFITLLYFFAIYPFLLMYSVAITNTTNSFILNQLHVTPPSRVVTSLILILFLMGIVRFGQDIVLKAMNLLVYPFITMLVLMGFYLIPYWSLDIFHAPLMMTPANGGRSLWMGLWLIIPVMVFSFNHSPIISSFAVSYKNRYGKMAEERCNAILKYSHIIMVLTVLFFVSSCVLSLSPADLVEAKQQNISILSYLANHFNAAFIADLAPIIAFLAISKSFLGHYLGAAEGMKGLLLKSPAIEKHVKKRSDKSLLYVIDLFIIVTCWITAAINPSVLSMIEMMGGPVIAMILFIMPIYAIYRVPALATWKNRFSDAFTFMIGIITLSAIIYGLF